MFFALLLHICFFFLFFLPDYAKLVSQIFMCWNNINTKKLYKMTEKKKLINFPTNTNLQTLIHVFLHKLDYLQIFMYVRTYTYIFLCKYWTFDYSVRILWQIKNNFIWQSDNFWSFLIFGPKNSQSFFDQLTFGMYYNRYKL